MDIWNFIQKELSDNNNVMLITVVERNGSSPGIVGFKMAVSETGSMHGSIGGGVMEYNMVELAKKEAKKATQKSFIKKQIHKADAGKDKSGLICSGDQTHSFTLFDSSSKEIINNITTQINNGEKGALYLNQSGIKFNETISLEKQIEYSIENENNWEFKEQIGVKPTMYIFGAGHVSLPLSEIFRVLDFRVIVLDDREGLSTFESNKHAHQKYIIDYKNIGDIIEEGTNSYAVIMTVAHKSDAAVLKQLVRKDLKYLGMIGSKNKVKNIYELLMNEGISVEELAKVDSPIGIPIKSKTTAEIAISIAAKVIEVKNC
jgi:xanthine dehydrogenase accessory factor